jgi:Protein of unknown function (DUF3551)
MRKALFCLTIATGFAAWCFFAVGVANADPYKWCAQYGGEEGGGTNCGFITIEQCRATISGMGGFCVPNPFYTGPDQTPAKHSRKRTLRGPA